MYLDSLVFFCTVKDASLVQVLESQHGRVERHADLLELSTKKALEREESLLRAVAIKFTNFRKYFGWLLK